MMRKLFSFIRRNPYRILVLVFADGVMLVGASIASFLLRFEGSIPAIYLPALISLATLNIGIIIPLFFWQRLYTLSLTFVSIQDLYRILKAVLFATILSFVAATLLRDYKILEGFPRSTILINALFAIVLLGFVRIAKRMVRELKQSASGKRILVIGAEDAGVQLVRTLLATHAYTVVGFLDDNPTKQHTTISQVPVLGRSADIGKVFLSQHIDEIIITESAQVKRVIEIARSQNIDMGRLKVLPSIRDIIDGKITLTRLRDISIADLLGRESVTIDTRLMRSFLHNKRVLVTGAAGSIGSQLVLQILTFEPSLLIVVDQHETGMFYLERKVCEKSPDIPHRCIVADVCDEQAMHRIFAEMKPQIVFHAAAYKHVPVMEANPLAAIKNNVFGTLTVGNAARSFGVEKFVFISTDKAVRPVSVMGMTKHVGEMICVMLHKLGSTKFCAVRFGNVLDSQGNVIELFREQIKRGGPVEITHPDMQRYFMVTSEACLLVMQAGALSTDGEIFCLDMGKPVKVVDLAREMIRLAGYEPEKDIPIAFTNPRPGEKLYEELLIEGETPTQYEKIFVASLHGMKEHTDLSRDLSDLKRAIHAGEQRAATALLSKMVSTNSHVTD